MTAIVLANTCIRSHNYHFVFVVRTFRIYSLSNFQVYDTVLLTIITLHLFLTWLHLDQPITSCKGLSSHWLRCPMQGSREGSSSSAATGRVVQQCVKTARGG